jgi:hypothetical protein
MRRVRVRSANSLKSLAAIGKQRQVRLVVLAAIGKHTLVVNSDRHY